MSTLVLLLPFYTVVMSRPTTDAKRLNLVLEIFLFDSVFYSPFYVVVKKLRTPLKAMSYECIPFPSDQLLRPSFPKLRSALLLWQIPCSCIGFLEAFLRKS